MMDTMKRKVMKRSKVVLVACAVSVLAFAQQASAQEIEVRGPLAGAPAVIGMRVYREMRFQLQLQASMTLPTPPTKYESHWKMASLNIVNLP